jgi:hypothetical protein
MATHKIDEGVWYAELDSRRRINLAALEPAPNQAYRVRKEANGTIVLEPAAVMTLMEAEALGIR